MSLYPRDKDRWRRIVDGVDQMVAVTINGMYAACVAIEAELGVKPSGKFGSIYSRIFGTGNVAKRSGLWRPVSFRLISSAALSFARNATIPREHQWRQGQMAGNDTAFGTDVPACFGAVQWPLFNRGGVPWRSFLVLASESKAGWVARDGSNSDFSLSDGSQVFFGVLCWNIKG